MSKDRLNIKCHRIVPNAKHFSICPPQIDSNHRISGSSIILQSGYFYKVLSTICSVKSLHPYNIDRLDIEGIILLKMSKPVAKEVIFIFIMVVIQCYNTLIGRGNYASLLPGKRAVIEGRSWGASQKMRYEIDTMLNCSPSQQ